MIKTFSEIVFERISGRGRVLSDIFFCVVLVQ